MLSNPNYETASASTSFWVIGDTPYSSAVAAALTDYLHNIPPEVKFIVHVGDIRPGTDKSSDASSYIYASNLLKQSSVPVFVLPGDNEYNDATNPQQAWQQWVSHFTNFEQNWSSGLSVTHQSIRPENLAFVENGVLYIGINLVGGRVHDAKEWTKRAADDLAWIQENFAAHKGEVTSAVILGQAAPGTTGYSTFQSGFVNAAKSFELPVLYVQGDLHKWQYDSSYGGAANLTRIVIGATGPDTLPLKITASQGLPYQFSYDHDFSSAPMMTGTDQSDVLSGNAKDNMIFGFAGNDIIDGGGDNDTIYGGAGNDILIGGGTKADTLDGGSGINTASYASSLKAVTVNLATGVNTGGDAAGDILVNIQNITGSSNGDTLTGDVNVNVIDGGKGNDTLDGGGGHDVLIGGAGNDTFIVGANSVTLVELAGGGTDTVTTSVGINLSLLSAELENVTLTGTANINAIGNALANILTGNNGNNVLDGGVDGTTSIVDQLKGGLGNDTYIVRDVKDKVTESANQGVDTVESYVSYTLASNLENLHLLGTGASSAVGNTVANVIVGNDGANLINGKAGDDMLTGGGGADVFLFDTKLSTSGTSNIDHITDFELGIDTIQLQNADFTKLTKTGILADALFTADPLAVTTQTRIIYDLSTGKLFYDSDGSGSKQAVQFATLDDAPSGLTAHDFYVV